ncbi:MAG TPA: hypothetical protein VLB74_02020 [Flavobacterium sp.]|uniref:hypothetical protein n=1 Tax=Flavobacterium sp. TaxID=239 RepID=UPI002BB076EB|nr:hypothetical protein [Flavobacterium sp.]HSD13406.1 hypothetical protein [Flavobacterium sp.]
MKYLFFSLLFLTAEAMLAQDGTLDATFNGNGRALAAFNVFDSAVHSMVLQQDGKIIAGGTVSNHGVFSQFALARFNSNGTLDPTFGTAGLVIGDFSIAKISLNTTLLQSSGKIVTGGIAYNDYEDSQFVLTRFNNDGSFDNSFGTAGLVLRNFLNIKSLVAQPDEKIVVAGFSIATADRDFVLLRFNPDGSVDNSFGTNGEVVTTIGAKDFANDITLQTDGKIVLAGAVKNAGGDYYTDFAIVRYFDDGNIDTSFGTNGVVVIDIDEMDEANSVKVQSDGKIVISGWSSSISGDTATFQVIRLLPNGSIDVSFGGSGIFSSPILFSSHEQLIQVQSDAKILIVGAVATTSAYDVAMIRLQSNGSLDTTFGTNGVVVTTDGPETSSQANCILLQPDGKILIGGESGEGLMSYHPHFVIQRYDSGLGR